MNGLFRQLMLTPLDGEARDQLRERLIADQDLFDQLREEENEWIDACAAGRLSPADAALLHQHLAATGQTHRLATAIALSRPRPKPQSVFACAFGIAAVVVIGFALAFQSRHTVDRATTPPTEPPLFVASLTPGSLRDGAAVPSIPPRNALLQLMYQDTAPTGQCRVTIRRNDAAARAPITEECGLDFHPFHVPSGLPPGRYLIELATGQGELIHTYNVNIGN